MFYRLIRIIFRAVFGILFRPKIIGSENLPTTGGFILSANHVSNWDPPVLATFIEREVFYMAKEELFKNAVFAAAIRKLHAFPVKRDSADKNAIKTAVKVLKDGGCLGIFPEGTRSKTGKLGKAESGVSLIAAMTKAPIIPAAIINTDKIFSAETKFPRLAVVYGKPITFSGSSKDKDALATFAQDIMAEIAKLKIVGENLTK
ncbi:MAG: 1-acyl-sn-glycerol-3-phosphate acyltransferase [Selenomonadaceae bacterium]|nr:1-acyl-sn-glycerol-3-phosphate acyltransferase [Selenomonadaceae bacterium]